MTPTSVHYGEAPAVQRQLVYQTHPERFMRGISHVKGAPTAVYINPPDSLANPS